MAFKLKTQAPPKTKDGYAKATSKYYSMMNNLEDRVNSSMGNPMDKAATRRTAYTKKNKGNWVESDKVGHAAGGMYARQGISKKFGNGAISKAAGVIGSNLLGVGHELSSFNSDHGITSGAIEAGKDIVNNFIGSVSSSKNLEKNVEKYGTSGMSEATRKERMADMKSQQVKSPAKQKLSATAKRDKAARDLAFAKTPARREKKADNQRRHRANPNAKGLDWDHKNQRFESPAKNRGNDGKGTKLESGKNYKIGK